MCGPPMRILMKNSHLIALWTTTNDISVHLTPLTDIWFIGAYFPLFLKPWLIFKHAGISGHLILYYSKHLTPWPVSELQISAIKLSLRYSCWYFCIVHTLTVVHYPLYMSLISLIITPWFFYLKSLCLYFFVTDWCQSWYIC